MEIKATNRQLRLNRRILKSLCPEGKATIRKEVLLDLGFDFSRFNSIFPSSGKVYYLTYDYGFMPIYEREVVIIKKQQYLGHDGSDRHGNYLLARKKNLNKIDIFNGEEFDLNTPEKEVGHQF